MKAIMVEQGRASSCVILGLCLMNDDSVADDLVI